MNTNDGTQAQVADYVQCMLMELRSMCRARRMGFLTHLIEMAMIEAADIASGALPGQVAMNENMSNRPRSLSPDEIAARVLHARD